MKQVLVDTNVLVSFLKDRHESQRAQVRALLEAAVAGEHLAVLHTVVLVELVFVLTELYEQAPADVSEAVADLLALPGVVIATEVAWSEVLSRWPSEIASLGDAILATVAGQGRYDSVATFDLKLRRKLAKQGTPSYW
ncbi:MAG TPA: PIN domain-containing protein [Thermoanaerobaculia bacterium]|nr:PIN domain-containing protein [Thermoanaerobaculia bacterium]